MKVVFVVPCYNAAPNIPRLFNSLVEQTSDQWRAVFVDDTSSDKTAKTIQGMIDMHGVGDRVTLVKNEERRYALRNVVDTAKNRNGKLIGPSDIIAVMDADDQLCNPETVSTILQAHEDANASAAIWTAHKWDSNGMNISAELPEGINPYQYPWVTSHLKTFTASTLQNISDKNFQDMDGGWFKRGYDQALYLPILYRSEVRRFLPDVCYLYNLNSVSITRTGNEIEQLRSINTVRARGFID